MKISLQIMAHYTKDGYVTMTNRNVDIHITEEVYQDSVNQDINNSIVLDAIDSLIKEATEDEDTRHMSEN